MTQRFKKWSGIFLVLLLALVFLQASAYGADSPELLKEVRDFIRDNYYKNVNESVLRHNSVEAIIQALGDPHSEYFSPEEYKQFLDSTNGSYAGVGMVMSVEPYNGKDYPVVVSTFKDSPARQAGILPGDRIIAVNGEDVGGKDLDYVVSIVKGNPGTKVKLTVSRDGLDPFVVNLARRMIRIESVTYSMENDNIGYISVSQFASDSGKEVKKAVKALMAQGAKGIILDLRYNPGGFLEAGLEMAEIFIPNGKPVMHYRNREETHTIYSDGFPVDIPLVVLINRDSASASEIVAGAINDYGVGTLVGTTTYGKGTVQTVKELDSTPRAALKLTVAEYLSPKGKQINGKGVSPDIYVEGHEEQMEAARKILLEKIQEPAASKRSLFLYPAEGASYLDGKKVAGNGDPFLNGGTVMVPLRLVSVFLGGTITWDNSTRQAVLEYGNNRAVISVGSDYAVVDSQKVKLTSAVKVVEGRVCVPLRLLAAFDGITVNWDSALKRAEVQKN